MSSTMRRVGVSAMSTIARASGDDWDGHVAAYGDSSQVNPAQEYRRRLLLRRLRVGGMSRVVDIGSGTGDSCVDAACGPLPWSRSSGSSGRLRHRAGPGQSAQRALCADRPPERQTPGELSVWGTHATCSEVLEHVDRQNGSSITRPCISHAVPGSWSPPGRAKDSLRSPIGHRRHFTAASLRTV